MEIAIKLKKINKNCTLFNIYSDSEVLLLEKATKDDLIKGMFLDVDSSIKNVIIECVEGYYIKKVFNIAPITLLDYVNTNFSVYKTSATYKHLTNVKTYNFYYNQIHPYILEYSNSYTFQDELLQNVKNYSKVFLYTSNKDNLYDNNLKIQIDDKWFNKAIVYNGQQSSGLLELIQKPKNNMAAKLQYPKYKQFSKEILYTKTDNFYQFNTFWALQKDNQQSLFLNSCKSLSIDKVINTKNMDYGPKSFKKATLRAKDIKIRLILDNTSDVHIVSQFQINNTQISYK